MNFTRIAAASFILISGAMSVVHAQGLKTAQPAEYPPASYKARQYVDSRGCVFIRAGIDGATNWVPRVNRARQQLCGAKPTTVTGATKAPPVAPGFEVITLSPQDQPPVSAPKQPTKPVPTVAAKPKPVRPATILSAPAATTKPAPRVKTPTKPKTKPRATTAVPPSGSAPGTGGCAGASALSQQYINQGADVRCGPQTRDPLGFLRPELQPFPGAVDTGAHVAGVYPKAGMVTVPDGYKSVWKDGRLNPQRGARSASVYGAPIGAPRSAPTGFRFVDRGDDRYNEMRGVRTAAGDAQMAQLWTNTLPRKSVTVSSAPQSSDGLVMRLSTRSAPVEAPVASAKPRSSSSKMTGPVQNSRYVRAGVFAGAAEAKRAAQALARDTGLSVRLGTLSRNGQSYKVVLAGPFAAGAEAALRRVQTAGYPGARLSK